MNISTFSRLLAFCTLSLFTIPLAAQGPAPGPEHALLKKMEGTWIAAIDMGGQQSTGTMTSKMELGGLWLVTKFEGEFGGMKFQGRGLDTYDEGKKKYLSVWVDSMGTKPMLSEGTYDKEKKTLTMLGESTGPDGNPAKFKMVTKHINDDHLEFTMFMLTPDGQEQKMMTTQYRRKK